MLVFVLNAGSSSLKYQLIDTKSKELKASGLENWNRWNFKT